MEEEQKKTLCAQLGVVDDSLFFLLLIIAATLLSFWSVSLQRKGLCLTIQGETETAGQRPLSTHPAQGLRHHRRRAGLFPVRLCVRWRRQKRAATVWRSGRHGATCGRPYLCCWPPCSAIRTWILWSGARPRWRRRTRYQTENLYRQAFGSIGAGPSRRTALFSLHTRNMAGINRLVQRKSHARLPCPADVYRF